MEKYHLTYKIDEENKNQENLRLLGEEFLKKKMVILLLIIIIIKNFF